MERFAPLDADGAAGARLGLSAAPPRLSAHRDAAALPARDPYRNATQTVFGEGKRTANVVLVGEQPGDKEDLVGRPFVGPAGRVLDESLAEAGIDRDTTYVTNAVKNLKRQPAGKRRLHENRVEIVACKPWLEAEIRILKPQVIVCLGATAAQTLISPTFRVTRRSAARSSRRRS